VVKELLERKIQVRSIGFSNAGSSSRSPEESYAIRVSTAFFNTGKQIEIFTEALQEVLMRIV
jgi:selenocysteine lyase/cysteine desulfurase